MKETVFTAKNITKRYGKVWVLTGVNMEIRRGDIYGFIGGNGAGKTTLMRILTGMAKCTAGEIEIFGKNETNELCIQRGRMGAMIEKPALYPGMTARDNLEVFRLQRGLAETKCIDEALETVGLTDTKAKRVKNFSLGMKQRLGLAVALLGNQEFLVLDEPMNGLDPEGIVAFREILQKLNREHGTTILISTHLLGEMDQLATCYGFIHKGKIIEQITSKELFEKCRTYLSIYVDDAKNATIILRKKFPEYEIKIVEEHSIHLYGFVGNTGEITKTLVSEMINVKEMKVKNTSLEQYYMTILKGMRKKK